MNGLPTPPAPNCLCLKSHGTWLVDENGTIVHAVGSDPKAKCVPLDIELRPLMLRKDVADWCFDHIGPTRLIRTDRASWIEFKSEGDMLVFTMKWGSL